MRRMLSGWSVMALSAWGVAAPFLFAGDEAADWGWSRLIVVPGLVAVAGGAGMLRGSRPAARLALAGGLWFMAGPVLTILWTGGGVGTAATLEDPLRLLVWLAFFFETGVVIALLGAHALGLLETMAVEERAPARTVSRAGAPAPCGSRRRRQNARPATVRRHARTRGLGGG